MRFEILRRRVERGEQLVTGRADQTQVRARALRTEWRDAWTPSRIIIAGLVSGFAFGRSDPSGALRKVGKIASPRWLQTITAVSGLFASLQATVAAATAKGAADTADDAAGHVQQAAGDISQVAGPIDPRDAMSAQARSDRSRPDPVWAAQPPAAAEAATDVSER